MTVKAMAEIRSTNDRAATRLAFHNCGRSGLAGTRASTISNLLKRSWDEYTEECPFEYPVVTQWGSFVLIEGKPASLGVAATILVKLNRYDCAMGGQWFELSDGQKHWNGWLEVQGK